MTAVLALLGFGAGSGLLLVGWSLVLPRRLLDAELERYRLSELAPIDQRTRGSLRPERTETGPALLRPLAQMLAGLGERRSRSAAGDRPSQAADLAITGRTVERHGVTLAWCLLGGAGVPLAAMLGLRAAGLGVPAAVSLPLAVVGGASGAMIGQVELRRSAGRSRSAFLAGLKSWLELVSLAQAGGMGVEGAMEAASRISTEHAFRSISDAITSARHSGATPWQGLSRLGRELGIGELEELAATLELAGAEGARIRSSLEAKAGALRRRQMADAQARANSTTERLFLPSIVLMLGFMVFLMFPAGVSLAHVI